MLSGVFNRRTIWAWAVGDTQNACRTREAPYSLRMSARGGFNDVGVRAGVGVVRARGCGPRCSGAVRDSAVVRRMHGSRSGVVAEAEPALHYLAGYFADGCAVGEGVGSQDG